MAITCKEAEKKREEEQKKIKILEKEELENFKKQGENFFDKVIINKINILKKGKKVKIRYVSLYFLESAVLESDNLILSIPNKYVPCIFYYLKERYKEVGWMISSRFPHYSIIIKKIK